MLPNKIKLTPALIQLIINKRNVLGLTAYQLSDNLGKNQSWIPNIENKRTKNISREECLMLFSYLLGINEVETEIYLEEIVYKEKEDNIFQPLFDATKFQYELFKQVHHSRHSISDLENNNGIKIGTLQKLCRNNVNILPTMRYEILTKVFTMLDYINPKCMDTYLHMLGVPVPSDKKLYFFDDINKCYKLETNFPTNTQFYNWGEFLDFNEWELNLMEERYQDQADETEYKLNQIEKENQKRKTYSSERKIELEVKLNEAFSVLKKIIDNIDTVNYEKTLNSERYLETIIGLLTDSDGMKIFSLLFKYPLHKIDPKNLKDICDFIDSKLDYEYSIHIKEDVQKEAICIDDLLEDYSHLDCRYKPEIWGELNEMIDFAGE